ncbi:hypothetical protein Glove_420g51 [Diversispora epigaea]|uniref:Uncharacterized protein n=1 Tax=Diversispora epigaea TaxID=1348612 RepID=A0A397H0J0_9GLOM|nr:hypothetical protein Glove_420g51 [Diversispora epigaea]
MEDPSLAKEEETNHIRYNSELNALYYNILCIPTSSSIPIENIEKRIIQNTRHYNRSIQYNDQFISCNRISKACFIICKLAKEKRNLLKIGKNGPFLQYLDILIIKSIDN